MGRLAGTDGTRCRFLSKTTSGDTLLLHHEVMSGPLAWLIELLYRERIEQGIQLVDESVAARAEIFAARDPLVISETTISLSFR